MTVTPTLLAQHGGSAGVGNVHRRMRLCGLCGRTTVRMIFICEFTLWASPHVVNCGVMWCGRSPCEQLCVCVLWPCHAIQCGQCSCRPLATAGHWMRPIPVHPSPPRETHAHRTRRCSESWHAFAPLVLTRKHRMGHTTLSIDHVQMNDIRTCAGPAGRQHTHSVHFTSSVQTPRFTRTQRLHSDAML
jgi:hypothetical protein